MRNENLVGQWSERDLHPSDPECADLVFRADGTGWMYWCSWSTSFQLDRFRWRETAPGVVEVRLTQALSGTWSVADGVTRHEVEEREPADTTSTYTFRIAGNPLVLELDRRFDQYLSGNRFAFVDRETVDPLE